MKNTNEITNQEIPNLETITLKINDDRPNSRVFSLSETQRMLWENLPNVVAVIGDRYLRRRYEVRVLIPEGYLAYSYGVVSNGKLVFSYKKM